MTKYWDHTMECMDRSELCALQEKRLRDTVSRVYEKVQPYRERMDAAGVKPEDIQTLADLHKLPFTTKRDLRDFYPYGLFAVPLSDVVRLHASSGTTGKQIVVGYTRKDLEMWSDCCARSLVAAGGTPEDLMHVSYGYGLFTGGLGLHGGAERLGMTVIPVSTGNTPRQINIIRDFGSDIICCTPSYALYLAETMQEMGVSKDEIKLRSGIFGAEPWTEEMRHEIEDKLNLKAYDIYGLTEIVGPGVAYECEEQAGMHICEDNFIPEIVDPDTGEVLPPGSKGELVFTCITKEAFPLLRYRTRDIASLDESPCACGRTLIRMRKPTGRSDDMLIIRGINVFPSQIESVLLQCGQTAPYYQLLVDRVNNTDTLEVLVELQEKDISDTIRTMEELASRIRASIESAVGLSVKVRLVEPRSLPRVEGKAQHVIDKRQLK